MRRRIQVEVSRTPNGLTYVNVTDMATNLGVLHLTAYWRSPIMETKNLQRAIFHALEEADDMDPPPAPPR